MPQSEKNKQLSWSQLLSKLYSAWPVETHEHFSSCFKRFVPVCLKMFLFFFFPFIMLGNQFHLDGYLEVETKRNLLEHGEDKGLTLLLRNLTRKMCM